MVQIVGDVELTARYCPDMHGALVLNASYEPLSVVSSRRATCLVLADKAELLEDDGTVLRSERQVFPGPSVIRLRYMVKVPYVRRTALSRRAIFSRDEHTCQYCGGRADSIDHVMPRSRGGEHSWENVASACRACNLFKRDRTPEEAGMVLATPCRAPSQSAWVVVSRSTVPDSWRSYLPIAS